MLDHTRCFRRRIPAGSGGEGWAAEPKKKEVVLPQPPQDADQADATSKVNVDERAHRISARGKRCMGNCCASVADHGRVAQWWRGAVSKPRCAKARCLQARCLTVSLEAWLLNPSCLKAWPYKGVVSQALFSHGLVVQGGVCEGGVS